MIFSPCVSAWSLVLEVRQHDDGHSAIQRSTNEPNLLTKCHSADCREDTAFAHEPTFVSTRCDILQDTRATSHCCRDVDRNHAERDALQTARINVTSSRNCLKQSPMLLHFAANMSLKLRSALAVKRTLGVSKRDAL